jgi:hypothetical protein
MFDTERYDIIRFYFNKGNTTQEVVREDVTLQDAQAHCKDPESSSSTCTMDDGTARTAERGEWFDGYERTDHHG